MIPNPPPELLPKLARYIYSRFDHTNWSYDDVLSELGLQWCVLVEKKVIAADQQQFGLLIHCVRLRLIDNLRKSRRYNRANRPSVQIDSLEQLQDQWSIRQDVMVQFVPKQLQTTVNFDIGLELDAIRKQLHMRPGLDMLLEGYTLKELSDRLHISESRAKQLKDAALERAGYTKHGSGKSHIQWKQAGDTQ